MFHKNKSPMNFTFLADSMIWKKTVLSLQCKLQQDGVCLPFVFSRNKHETLETTETSEGSEVPSQGENTAFIWSIVVLMKKEIIA